MTDTVLLYVVFGVMLVAAIAAILPTFLRARPNDAHEDEHAAFLRNSLREEAERLEAEFAQGLHTEEAYRSLREDLERRAVEEMKETEATKSRVVPVSLRNAVIGVVALYSGIYLKLTYGEAYGETVAIASVAAIAVALLAASLIYLFVGLDKKYRQVSGGEA